MGWVQAQIMLKTFCYTARGSHVAFVWGGAGLIALHVAGAVKHVIKRDGTLLRMLPGVLFKN